MSEAAEILRSYVHLLLRLSRAASVSVYVPPRAPGDQVILIHDGAAAPLPELESAQAAAVFHEREMKRQPQGSAPLRVHSLDAAGLLHRIPLKAGALRPEEETAGRERRRTGSRHWPEQVAWIGFRHSDGGAGAGAPDSRLPPAAAGDEQWWQGLLGLAGAFAAHTRTASRVYLDQVTRLPERTLFLAELQAVLAHARRNPQPTVLLLLGPDDFGWVNERLDRRSGDAVLQEVATALRAGLRAEDHVARYGGAIFTGILAGTNREQGMHVAQNLARQLAERRYHGATLRLEFSAGVAEAVPTEPIDAEELIRRADQALSAAKRGHAGNVRLWEKGSDVEQAGSLDRLQGIFTGDRSKDYRNMGLLLDQVAIVSGNTDPPELARRFAERLFQALHAHRVGVLECSGDGFGLLAGIERSGDGVRPFRPQPRDEALLEQAILARSFVAERGGGPGALSVAALPLCLEERCLGGIVLEVTSAYVSFEGSSDRKFLDALASQLAMALDRTRLIERERRRQREEKERLEAEVNDLRRVVKGSRLAYRSSEMEAVLLTARKVAGTDTTVLITGESGTGKEMLAHTVHELSRRCDRPFVVVDCGAISPSLIESELFGHERGAFTGADARKLGRLAQADGATVFLDEIGDLPLDLQGKLLRFVQEKQLTPVGGVLPRTVDVRIIAATNADLQSKVLEGRFREDLFHRLNVVRLHVPPLRERTSDILHLAQLFLHQFAALYRRPVQRFTSQAEQALVAHPWPGNVRELQNMVLTAVLLSEGPEIHVGDLSALSAPGTKEPGPFVGAMGVVSRPEAGAIAAAAASPESADPERSLRRALAHEIATAIGGGRPGRAPLGRWLAEDLVLAADALSGGTLRRGADLLGLPETTYRRQLRLAVRNREAGTAVRSPSWSAVAATLEAVIKAKPENQDACAWAESCLLAEIDAAVPSDVCSAAALLGVTEPTLLRRRSSLGRRS
jgi:diguanylate cyclase (GGDEF)-like protein